MTRFATVGDAYLLMMREVTQFFRRPTRLLSFVLQPLLFLALFGFGIKAALRPDVGGFDYVHFILPGIAAQRMLMSASRGGMGLIRDRNGGFLKSVLVAPVSRISVLLGLSSGHVFRSFLQAMMLLLIGVWMGLPFGGTSMAPLNFLMVLLIVAAMGLSIIMLSMALAWKMDDQQDFATVTGYLTMPLFLLSGALYRLDRLPAFLSIPVKLNPLTYGVDAMRHFALAPEAANWPIHLDLMAIAGFFLLSLSVGVHVMRTRQGE